MFATATALAAFLCLLAFPCKCFPATPDSYCSNGLATVRQCFIDNGVKRQVYVSYFWLPRYGFFPNALKEQCQNRQNLDQTRICIANYRTRCGKTLGYLKLLDRSMAFHQALCDDPSVDFTCLMGLNSWALKPCVDANAVHVPDRKDWCAKAEVEFQCAVGLLRSCDLNTANFFKGQRLNVLPQYCIS